MTRFATVTGDEAIAEGVETHAAGSSAVGQYRCRNCGYGITVRTELPWCPMCGGDSWEDASSRPVPEDTKDVI